MKISITKKIIALVSIPILLICLAVGIVSANIMRIIITDEIEMQLKVGAYSASQTLEYISLKEEMNKDIYDLHDYTDIDVTIFQDDTRVASTIENAVGTKMDKGIYEELQTGKDYFATDANVNGQPYFGYYIPFFENGNFTGATFTGIPQVDANKVIFTTTMKIVFCILGYGLLFVAIALFFVRKMVKSIKGLERTISTLLDNDLATKHDKYEIEHDELEEICNKTVDFSEHLMMIINKINNMSNESNDSMDNLNMMAKSIETTSEDVVKAINEISIGAVTTSEDTEYIAKMVASIGDNIENIKNNTDMLTVNANNINNTKNTVLETLKDLEKVNGDISVDITDVNDQIEITNMCVEKIKDVIKTLKSISDQTNLLSLNARIEASRSSGESGRGFAVVATEISELATQSANSSNEMEKSLNELLTNYSLIVEKMNVTTNNINSQNEKLSDTKNVFSTLDEGIKETVDEILNINNMIEELDNDNKQILDKTYNLSAIVQQSSASCEEVNASCEEFAATINVMCENINRVKDKTEELLKQVRVFKI